MYNHIFVKLIAIILLVLATNYSPLLGILAALFLIIYYMYYTPLGELEGFADNVSAKDAATKRALVNAANATPTNLNTSENSASSTVKNVKGKKRVKAGVDKITISNSLRSIESNTMPIAKRGGGSGDNAAEPMANMPTSRDDEFLNKTASSFKMPSDTV